MSDDKIVIRNMDTRSSKIKVIINDVNRMSRTIAELEARITELNEQIATQEITIAEQAEQILQLNAEIAQLNVTITSLNAQITSLSEQVSSLQTTITSLNAQISALNAGIENVNGETVINPLPYLAETKSLLLSALIDKGASLTVNSPFRDYVSAVENISPTPQGDPHTTLLLHLDRTYGFNDASIYNRPIEKYFTGTEPFINENTTGKFSNACMELDGTNCIYINQTDFFPFSTPGWTIEFFYYPNSWTYNSYYCFVSNYHSFTINGTSYTRYQRFSRGYNYSTESPQIDYYRPQSSAMVNEIAYGASMSNNAWHHFAIVRNSLDTTYKFRIYVDGTGVSWRGSNLNIGGDYFTPLDSLPVPLYFFGMARNNTTPNNFCPCWVNEIRISDVCRYTENFTPPTEPFTI